MMTPSQMEQAIKYGIFWEFNRGENIFADYDSIWKGYERFECKNGGWYDLTSTEATDWKKNKHVVEFLAEHGYKIKVLPELLTVQNAYKIKWSNPDILLNGILTDIKEVEELNSNGIKSRIRSAYNQRVTTAVIYIPDEMPEEEISRGFARWAGEKNSKRLKVFWIYKGMINTNLI